MEWSGSSRTIHSFWQWKCKNNRSNVKRTELNWTGLLGGKKAFLFHSFQGLTRKVAMAPPMMKPAMMSDQWLRYSATLFRPVRNARHMSVRDSTGLASLVPLACTVHVTYICEPERQTRRIGISQQHSSGSTYSAKSIGCHVAWWCVFCFVLPLTNKWLW